MSLRVPPFARKLLSTSAGERLKRPFLERRNAAIVQAYLRENSPRRLQVGAGKNFREGWLNTDLFPEPREGFSCIPLDATRPFPFPDASFDYAFSEHMIEHVDYPEGLHMLGECFRVLKSGGKIRIATPDLQFLVDLLQPELTPLQKDYVAWAGQAFLDAATPTSPATVVNNFVRDWGHQFIYDRETLSHALRQAGFRDVRAFELGESDDPELRDLEGRGDIRRDFLQLETFVVEACKP